jgi:hypothetical protein
MKNLGGWVPNASSCSSSKRPREEDVPCRCTNDQLGSLAAEPDLEKGYGADGTTSGAAQSSSCMIAKPFETTTTTTPSQPRWCILDRFVQFFIARFIWYVSFLPSVDRQELAIGIFVDDVHAFSFILLTSKCIITATIMLVVVVFPYPPGLLFSRP